MGANFNGFLSGMTGPARLRSELSKSTLPVSHLLTAVNSCTSVRVRLPATVLGGDIFALMSKSLRHLLEVSAPAEIPSDGSRATRGTSVEDFTHRESMKTLLTAPEFSADRGGRSENSYLGRLEHHGSLKPVSVSSGSREARDSPMASSKREVPESVFPLPPTIARSDVHLVSDRTELVAGSKRNGNAVTSLLGKKLREYWELTKAGRSQEPNYSEMNLTGLPSQSSIVHYPAPISSAPISRPWPDFVGREISLKARAASDQFSGEASSGMSQGTSEKVEIQNVFNIEVRNETNSERGFDDLSERITEILNEQALQHGIDVT